jgi:hypothetical protein
MYWWKTPIEKTVRLSTSIYEYGDHSEEEMYQLIAENKVLKKSLQAFPKKWWVESDFTAPNLPLPLRLKGSGCHYNSIFNNTGTN